MEDLCKPNCPSVMIFTVKCPCFTSTFLTVKALVGAFNKEKALVGSAGLLWALNFQR